MSDFIGDLRRSLRVKMIQIEEELARDFTELTHSLGDEMIMEDSLARVINEHPLVREHERIRQAWLTLEAPAVPSASKTVLREVKAPVAIRKQIVSTKPKKRGKRKKYHDAILNVLQEGPVPRKELMKKFDRASSAHRAIRRLRELDLITIVQEGEVEYVHLKNVKGVRSKQVA